MTLLLLLFVVIGGGCSVAADTVTIQPRGWGPVHCHLVTNHTTWGEQRPTEVDFWIAGGPSGLRYGCRFGKSDVDRKRLLAESLYGIENPHTWIGELSRWFRQSYYSDDDDVPKKLTTRQPIFACIDPKDDGPGSALLTTMLPVRTRRDISGFDPRWQGCEFVSSRLRRFEKFNDAVITVSFRGGSQTIVCGISIGIHEKHSKSLVNMSGIVDPPYQCFLVTYLDFPGITYPPCREIVKETVEKKWRVADKSRAFPPYSCWWSKEDAKKRFDFEVLVNGEFGRRCQFHGGCPDCTDEFPSTPASTSSSSHNDAVLPDLLIGG